jgi:hypothetical protein
MKNYFLLVSFLVITLSLNSQIIVRSVIGSISSNNSENGLTLQQAVGQPSLVNNEKVNDVGLRQGFQQPIYFIEEQNDLNVTLYPNPNQGEFSFIVEENDETKLQFSLFDQQGKLIFQGNTDSNILTPISVQNPSPGMYHLKVANGVKVSSFKINVIQ